VRRIHGVYERSGRVAIAWYARPDELLRERTRRCVFGAVARPRV
jgi:hypothetical protein